MLRTKNILQYIQFLRIKYHNKHRLIEDPMKQSTIIFLVLFSVVITNAQSRGKTVTSEQHVKKRSLLVHGNITQAPMTIHSFEKGGDGERPSDCDGKYHSNSELIVALSSRWYSKGEGCFVFINIYYHDKSVKAMVIDECGAKDCPDNIVVASKAVWIALQVPQSEWGKTVVTWSVPTKCDVEHIENLTKSFIEMYSDRRRLTLNWHNSALSGVVSRSILYGWKTLNEPMLPSFSETKGCPLTRLISM